MSDRVIRVALVVLGIYEISIGLFAGLASETFYEQVAPYGQFNRHLLQDAGAFEAAIGLGALVAVPRRSWWAPVLTVAAFHFGLHAVSHLVDIDEADPEWLGYAEFAGIAAGGVLLAWLARQAGVRNRAPG